MSRRSRDSPSSHSPRGTGPPHSASEQGVISTISVSDIEPLSMIPLWIHVDLGDIMGELLLDNCKYMYVIWTKTVQNLANYGLNTTKIENPRDSITCFGFL